MALLFLIGFVTKSASAADFNKENIDFIFKNSDELTILSNQEMDETKAGWIWSAYKKSNKLYRGRKITYREAERIVRRGDDVYTDRRQDARKIADRSDGGRSRPIRDSAHERGTGHSHYHTHPRDDTGHVIYGRGRLEVKP